jgi:hypothetical protein
MDALSSVRQSQPFGPALRPSSGSPLASFVIMTYNDYPQLRGAIARARLQTWQHLEIIVVDDGSQKMVAEQLAAEGIVDDRLRVVRRPINGGVVAAIETGIECARGEFIYLGSTNDPVEPALIEASIETLLLHPSAGFCFSDPGVIDGWNGAQRAFPFGFAPKSRSFSPDELADQMQKAPFHISTNTIVYRTAALRCAEASRTAMGIYADWFTSVMIAMRDGAVYVPRVLSYSRKHPGAFSGNIGRNRASQLRAASAALKAVVTEMPEVVDRLRRSREVSHFGIRVLLALYDDPVCRRLIDFPTLRTAFLRDGWSRVASRLPDAGRRFARRLMSAARS